MASEKSLDLKKGVVAEITAKIKASEAVLLFSYQGLTVAEMSDLRNKLREVDAEVKIYKNTLLHRASNDLTINLEDFMEGPNALVFGKTLLEPIKVISEFAKDHDKLEIRVGVLSGEIADINVIREYATIPSREGLLTMLAGGMIQYVKDLSIALNLYSEQLPSDDTEAKEAPVEKPASVAEVAEEKETETEVEAEVSVEEPAVEEKAEEEQLENTEETVESSTEEVVEDTTTEEN